MRDPDLFGAGQRLFCQCRRGPSGTTRDGGDDVTRCSWHYKELLYDGPAGSAKTFADMWRIAWMMQAFPGLQAIVFRRTRVSSKISWVPILEEHVLGLDHAYLRKGGSRKTRTEYYDEKTKSRLVIAGTDKIEEYLSTEWDVVLFQEATEPGITEYDWNTIATRMRGVAVPHPHCDYPDGVFLEPGHPMHGLRVTDVLDRTDRFRDRIIAGGRVITVSEEEAKTDEPQRRAAELKGIYARKGEDDHGVPLFFRQRIAECNPSMIEGDQHWLMKRWKSRLMVRLRGSHEDNPRITADYLDELKALPEPFRSVYYEGKWVSVEGKCWPTYAPERHLILGEYEWQPTTGRAYLRITEPSWLDGGRAKMLPVSSVVAGFDWGIDHPGSIQVMAIVGSGADKRAFRIAEILMSGGQKNDIGSIDWWAGQIVQVVDHYRIQVVMCDPSARAIYEHFNKALGSRAGRDKAGICQAADNTHATVDWVQGGIDLVRTMFAQDRLFLFRDCHWGPLDPVLKHKRRPTGLHEEIPGFLLGRDAQNPDRILPHPDAKRGMDDACSALRYVCMDIFDTERRLKPKSLMVGGHPHLEPPDDDSDYAARRVLEVQRLARRPPRW